MADLILLDHQGTQRLCGIGEVSGMDFSAASITIFVKFSILF